MRQSIQWKKQREVQRSIISCNGLCEKEKCVSNFWKGIRSYTVILGRIRSDSGQSRSHLNWQRRISETQFRISVDDVPFTLSWSYALLSAFRCKRSNPESAPICLVGSADGAEIQRGCCQNGYGYKGDYRTNSRYK